MSERIDLILRGLVGELVWSAKRGYGTFLTMEFGQPHMVVREPKPSTNNDALVANILRRRRVTIVGDTSLWIRDSEWSLSSEMGVVDLNSSDTAVEAALQNLDGQKLVDAKRSNAHTLLEFDLGAVFRLGDTIFLDEPTSVLWTLYRYENSAISLLRDGSAKEG